MAKYLNEMISRIRLDEKEQLPKDILASQGVEIDDEDLQEMSDSSGAGPYSTPFAFGKASDKSIESLGYKKVKKKPGVNVVKEDSEFMKVSKQMHLTEVSYKDYKNDPTSSSKFKLNNAIKEINSRLFQVERYLKQNRKLKEEENLGTDEYWKSTAHKLVKMNERVRNLYKEIKNFGLEEVMKQIQEAEQLAQESKR